MKPATQTIVGVGNPRANCLMASVASIVECSVEALPDLYELEQRGLDWFRALRDALEPYSLVPVIYDQCGVEWPAIAPKGFHIACGRSPRQEEDHAVVALDGKVVHDPHPSRDGLREGAIRWWILLLPAASTIGLKCSECGREGVRFCVNCQRLTEQTEVVPARSGRVSDSTEKA